MVGHKGNIKSDGFTAKYLPNEKQGARYDKKNSNEILHADERHETVQNGAKASGLM